MDGISDSMDMSLNKLREIVKDKASLVCCSPWGCKESDMTEQLNNNKKGCGSNLSTDRGLDKDVVHLHNGVFLSYKRALMPYK